MEIRWWRRPVVWERCSECLDIYASRGELNSFRYFNKLTLWMFARCSFGVVQMFRTFPLRIRLTLSGIVSIASVLMLAAIAIYSLWQSELELERQIKATKAVQYELTANLKHEAIDAIVVYSILRGPEARASKPQRIQKNLAQGEKGFRSSLAALQKLEMSTEVQAIIANLETPAQQFITRGQQIMALAFRDRAAAMDQLPEFQTFYEALNHELMPLGETIKTQAAKTASAARTHDMNLLYTLLGCSALSIVVMVASRMQEVRDVRPSSVRVWR